MTHPTLDEAQIRETAYLFWLDEGQPEGRDQEHWMKAIDALTPGTPKTARKAPAKPRASKKKAAAPKATAAKSTAARTPRAAKAPKAANA
jgi:hypothetical protein